MAKLRTATQLQAALDNEIGWRVNELSNFKAAITNSDGLRRTVLLRAAIPIAYSHWEGFIKKASIFYGVYLSSIGLTYKDLKPCFTGLGVMKLVQSIEGIKRRIATSSILLAEIQAFGEKPVSIKLSSTIDDVGNLTFSLFEEIAQFLAIDLSSYQARRNFIDESLINTRNKIAHGESLEVDLESAQTAFAEVIVLMRAFKTDIENSVTAKSYLR